MMKNNIKTGLILLASGMVATALQSCMSEDPFASSEDATLRVQTYISSDLTRAAANVDELSKSCILYISGEKGLMRKYKGLENVPAAISLKTGHYVAEAWAGDSVPASFDKKFYSAYQPFDLNPGDNTLALTCKIANVVVSVAPSSLDCGISNLVVKVSSSSGSLSFTEADIEEKGYFMMPFGESTLNYQIEGDTPTGQKFVKEGVIENVKKAHEYTLTLINEPGESIIGGAYFRVVIEDTPVVEDIIEIYGRPAVEGADFNIENQIKLSESAFTDKVVYVEGFNGLTSVRLSASDNLKAATSLVYEANLLSCGETTKSAYNSAGISWDMKVSTDSSTGVRSESLYITFKKSFFDNLPASDSEYVVTISAEDGNGKENSAKLRVANTEAAEEHLAPVTVVDPSKDLLSLGSTSAVLTVNVFEHAENPVLEYCENGSASWSRVNILTGASAKMRRVAMKTYKVTLSSLKPNTIYKYRIVDGEYVGDTMSFTTEGCFVIPNAGFENWSSYEASTLLGVKSVTFPGTGDRESNPFWESGNEGAATANLTLTDKSTNMLHSGSYSARLESKSAMGVIAAGNVFIGKYAKTDGTNGILELGRAFDGSHPKSVSVWVNYRPASNVKVKSGNESFVPAGFAGGSDHGQIYVALTTEKVEIRTNPNNRKLFTTDDACVLAYGEKTFTSAFGPEGALERIEIPIEYFERARSNRPLYIIIVASASKYGDYFSGASGSVFYLDDFELNY